MKTQALQENLKQALFVVERATARTPTLPALGAVLLTAEKNSLELSSTDLEMGIRYKILAKTEKEGSAAVPSKLFSQLVAALPEKEVSLNLHGGSLGVDSKEHQTSIKTLPTEDFPIIPSLDGSEKAVEVDTKTLCEGLAQVAGVAAPNQTRPEISGVFVRLQEGTARLAATDSFRLAEKTFSLPKGQTGEGSFILPAKTAREIVSILGELTEKTKLYLSPTQALFDYQEEGRTLQIVSRLIEGEYPQYQEVIPRNFTAKVRVSKRDLASRVKTASVFSGKMQDAKLALNPKKNELTVSSESADAGSHSSSLRVLGEGEPLEISFNWRFLLDGLSAVRSEEVEIAFAGQDAPALLRPLAKEQFLYVVMPVKA